MTRGTAAPTGCRVSARGRRTLYFGIELWLVLEAGCLGALLLIECSPAVMWIGAAALVAGLVGLVLLLRHMARRERQAE